MYLIVVIIYLIVLVEYAVMVTEHGSKNKFEKWFFHIDKYGNESNDIAPAFWFTLLFIGITVIVAVV